MLSSSNIRLLQNSSSVPQIHNSVQNSLLLLHLKIVHYVLDVQSHFTSFNIASGAGSIVAMTGENPQLHIVYPFCSRSYFYATWNINDWC